MRRAVEVWETYRVIGTRDESSRKWLPFSAAPPSTASGRTDSGGNYSIELGALAPGARVEAWYRGDEARFGAHANP